MPSTRSANFIEPYDDSRALPPASLELRAPSDMAERADKRWRRQHPARVGRPPEDDETEDASAIAVFEAMRDEARPRDLAEEMECSEERAKGLLKSARTRLASRIDEYLDAHLVATKVAAINGDAKPSQWAIENIGVGGERAIDPPSKNAPPAAAPTFNLGFVIGGMPQPAPTQRVITGEVVKPR